MQIVNLVAPCHRMNRTLLLTLAAAAGASALAQHEHGPAFVPDAVLSVSRQNIAIGGVSRYSTLVNGSLPGPTLRLKEGEMVWIRVYNDMKDQNTTMVSRASRHSDAIGYAQTGTWPRQSRLSESARWR